MSRDLREQKVFQVLYWQHFELPVLVNKKLHPSLVPNTTAKVLYELVVGADPMPDWVSASQA